MRLSFFSDYSLRVLMFAALKQEGFILDEVTEAFDISRNHLAQVVHNLAKLGYLHTQRGRGGGIQLALDPERIRLGKLIRETEEETAFVECFNPKTNTCRILGACRLKGFLAEAVQAFHNSLDQYTLRDLVQNPQQTRLRAAIQLPPARQDNS